jgi:hypothetical protein
VFACIQIVAKMPCRRARVPAIVSVIGRIIGATHFVKRLPFAFSVLIEKDLLNRGLDGLPRVNTVLSAGFKSIIVVERPVAKRRS